jgi:hypothetical protein
VRVIFTGSRDWEGFHPEGQATSIFVALLQMAFALNRSLTVVLGDCPTGLDAHMYRIALRWQEHHPEQLEIERHEAKWDLYGKPAGPIRNGEMVKNGGDMCIGFARPGSRGTVDCMKQARKAGIPTFEVPWNPQWPEPDQLKEQRRLPLTVRRVRHEPV